MIIEPNGPRRRPLAAVLAAPLSAPAWLATIFLACGMTGAVVFSTAAVVLLSTAIPLLVLALVGLPLLWLAFGVSRVSALTERATARTFLGADLPLRTPTGQGALPSRMWARTKTRASWLELLYALLVRPVVTGVVGTAVMLAWGTGVAFVLFPAYGFLTASPGALLGWVPTYAVSAIVHVAIGVALLLAAPWLARAGAAVVLATARALLSPSGREELETRVETLADTRSRMVAAADAERRRIERDLHDGAQQRLVALAMTLGRAKVARDPAVAAELVGEAHDEAKLALGELRDLARGIHPAVLTDRGLDAALSALAARSPTPVEVDVEVTPRPPGRVEAVAYFIAAESLANINKHAQAPHARITARRHGDQLTIRIVDDGRGGADPGAGSGIMGLRDRALAVDGDFVLTSPPGGPTTIEVTLPCTESARNGADR